MNSAKKKLLDVFISPGSIWRGKPFWSWNGELEPQEILRQINIIKEMGFGGHFMHSRTGLITEYLGKEWFDIINLAADESEKLGLESWLYDEDRWPSGCAGGKVTVETQYRMKSLTLIETDVEKCEPQADDIALFLAYIGDNRINMWFYTKISDIADAKEVMQSHPQQKVGEWKSLRFRIEDDPCTNNCNGTTYIDTMNRKATERFIELTHEAYKINCGDRIGSSIKGIFTDEPHRGHAMDNLREYGWARTCQTAYTDDLFEEFFSRYNYDIFPLLPCLFYRKSGKEVSPVKLHYFDLTNQLFIERFAKPINQWCEDNNMIFTGHVLHEDTLANQTVPNGSLMRFYEHMSYPGVDVLSEHNRCYWIVKQLASVARQLGKKWLLSELYGCSGWEMGLRGHKAVGDWQALFGINLRCPHLSWYTMEGESKRDYPASILHQSPWYKDYALVEDYFARFGILMQGKPVCDVLVLNPIESVWCQTYLGWAQWIYNKDENIEIYQKAYEKLFHILTDHQIDFDYGEEEMMSRMASVGTDKAGNPVLKIGLMQYRAVVVNGMLTIRATTMKLLDEFRALGGTVIFAGVAPAYVDAKESAAPADMAKECIQVEFEKSAIVNAVRAASDTFVEVLDESGKTAENVFAQVRDHGDNTYTVMLLNSDRDNASLPITVKCKLRGESLRTEEWDLTTGARYDASKYQTVHGDIISIKTSLTAGGTRAFVVTADDEALPFRRSDDKLSTDFCGDTEKIQLPKSDYKYKLCEENVCVLDFAQWRLKDDEWSNKSEVLKVDRQIRDCFGIEHRSGEMLQPWYSKQSYSEICGEIELKYTFEIDTLPSASVTLAAERPERMKYFVNGMPVSCLADGSFWVDICFKRMPIPEGVLRVGKNTVTVKTDFSRNTNIEAVYLLGDFGVKADTARAVITTLPKTLSLGNLNKQNLSFYTGDIEYTVPASVVKKAAESLCKNKSAKVWLVCDKFAGALIKVSFGGKTARLGWEPFEADVTDAVKYGADITVTLVQSRRNTFGPLHAVPTIHYSYGPHSFVTDGDAFTNDYRFIDSGIDDMSLVLRR